jgi:4-amino-4-deoxy-L-arabinose transferase-like glycosyltransferase
MNRTRSILFAWTIPEGALSSVVPSAISQNKKDLHKRRLLAVWYSLGLLLAVLTYFYALDSLHIPKNGDEYPYAHITRLTAASGHLLPLESQMFMRNTKPPLLFWQGIASTNWGKNWSLLRLRYPSVIYTLLTAVMVFLLGRRLSGQPEIGALASLTFLSFFNVYRYGRPFLTEAPMIFWTFLPIFAVLFWQPWALESSVGMPFLMGLALGMALLYKSFALALPVALALAWWYLDHRRYSLNTFLIRDAGKIVVLGLVSLTLFSLWFWLDPKPMEVFREFVLKENLSRFDPRGQSYLTRLVTGVSSIWGLALGYPVNAGLLLFPVLALFWISFQRRKQLGPGEKMLWMWIISLFVVFSLPSVRSGRYLLSAMPAIAVLCALHWERLSRKAFVASLLVGGTALAAIAYLCLRLHFAIGGASFWGWGYWALLAFTFAVILAGLLASEFTRPAVPAVALLICLSLAAALRPLEGPLGRFSSEAQQFVSGKQVWVPCNFVAVDEGYRFLLPGADVHCYDDDGNVALASLDTRYTIFAVRLPLDAPEIKNHRVIGQRLELRSRHNSQQLLDMLRGNVFNQLFVREFLVQVPGAQPAAMLGDAGHR